MLAPAEKGRRDDTWQHMATKRRARCARTETARGSMIPNRILRTLHAPALPRAPNSERAVDSKQNSEDTPRASAPTRQKQREVRPERAGRLTHQCCHVPKTARGSSIPNKIRRTLQALALPHAKNSESVVDSKQHSQEAPCASAPTCRNNEKGVNSKPNSQDAP